MGSPCRRHKGLSHMQRQNPIKDVLVHDTAHYILSMMLWDAVHCV